MDGPQMQTYDINSSSPTFTFDSTVCNLGVTFDPTYLSYSLTLCFSFSLSFIHFCHFYSAPSSPLLLRGAPDYSTDTVSVVGRLPLEKQTKESVRRDKRPSSVYCVSVSCLYCIGSKHLLVGASLSTVCRYCVKQLLAYFRKHLLAYFRKHLLAYFLKQLLRHLLQKTAVGYLRSLPPSPGQGRTGQRREGEEVGEGSCWRYRSSSN